MCTPFPETMSATFRITWEPVPGIEIIDSKCERCSKFMLDVKGATGVLLCGDCVKALQTIDLVDHIAESD